jgi:short-subunit dehydrogenase
VKTAVVTGASSGIGEVTARRLAADGWRLLLVARREERLKTLARELRDATWVAVDLTDPGCGPKIAEKVEAQLGGRLDLLVNNAGGNRRAGAFGEDEVGEAYVREIMEQNFFSALRVTEALLPILRRSAPSAIVNVSSIAGKVARPKMSAYNSAKFALSAWSDSLHLEEKPNGVHVGTVYPGFVSTEGFPQEKLVEHPVARRLVSTTERVTDAILEAAGGKAEISVPRWWGIVPRIRALAPAVVRRAQS